MNLLELYNLYQVKIHNFGNLQFWLYLILNLNSFDFYADKDFKNKSTKAYPIVFYCNGKCEVLDGKHRIGMQKEAGNKNMLMFVGYC